MKLTQTNPVLMICSITHFRNQVPGCNYLGTWIWFQLSSK